MNHNTNLHWVLHNLWILPDIEENKPSIAYSIACFLYNNYKKIRETQLEYLKTREHKHKSLLQQVNLSQFSWVL